MPYSLLDVTFFSLAAPRGIDKESLKLELLFLLIPVFLQLLI